MGRKPRVGDSPLSKLRVKAGMTQKQLSEKVGCSVSLIQKIERGNRNIIATHMFLRLARILLVDNRLDSVIKFRDAMENYWRKKKNER